jgi:hypothetical protein
VQLVEMGYDAVLHDVDMVWTTDPRELWLTDPELGGDVRPLGRLRQPLQKPFQ